MNAHRQISADYRSAGAMSDLINLYGFVDEAVFLTKSGDLGVVLGVAGVDDECLDAGQRDEVTQRFETALRLFDEHTRLYQYILKRSALSTAACSASLSTRAASDGPDVCHGRAVATLLRRREELFEAKQDTLYTLTIYWVVLAEWHASHDAWRGSLKHVLRDPATAVRTWLSTTSTLVHLDAAMERIRVQLRHRVDAFVAQLSDTLEPRVLSKELAFGFFRQLLNYGPGKAEAVRLREDGFLDYHVCDAALECHRTHLRIDDYYVRVITLKEPPAQTFAHLFRALEEIPSNLILANQWQKEGQGEIRREIHAKRRHFHNAKVSLTNYLTQTPDTPGELLVDDSAVALVRDLGAALTELTLQGRYFGQYSMTVVLYDTDLPRLERSVSASVKAFAAHDAQITDERYNLLNAWLAIVPGHAAYNFRSMHLLNTNYADCALLFGQDGGSARNEQLHREALALLETTQSTLYHLNLHVDDVAHTLVLGATGSGKSFLLNFLIAHFQRYAPKTLIFDLGGNYEALARHFGGRALRVTREHPAFTINPFCLPPSPANLQFLFAFVKVLIHTDDQYAMTRADDQALYEQLHTLYQLDADERRLFTLANILPRPLAQQLQRWVQGGQYADLFDHVEDTVTVADFQCLDFEGLDGMPQVLEPVLFYLLHRATATVLDPALSDRLKVFVLDEAWRFLRDPMIAAYVTEALKTWRKKNACVLLATQSSEDLERSALLRVAIESCPTKCFLANPNLDRPVYRELFHLNETEADRIATLIPRQQLLVKRRDGAKVLILNVDEDMAAMCSNRK